MAQEIKVKYGISCRSYNFGKKNARSYIFDEEFHTEYVLTGLSSDIWYLISENTKYSDILAYAESFGCSSQIEDFLQELQMFHLVETGIQNNGTVDNDVSDVYICNSAFEHAKTREQRAKWFSRNKLLHTLLIQLDENCNLFCEHCFNNKHSNYNSLSFDKIKSVIDDAYKLGILGVGITGGECTIHKDFLKIIQYIRSKHLYFSFITNGQRLYDEPDFFENVIACYPHEVKVSLYSMLPEVHDKITGVKGSCLKTIEVIKKLKLNNIYVNINHLRMINNIDSYKDVKNFAQSVNANFNPVTYFISNPNNNNSYLKYPVAKLESDFLHNDELSGKIKIFKEKSSKTYLERAVCRAGEMNLAVSPNLDVQPCSDFYYILGNLKKQSLLDIWNEAVPKFRKIFINKNLKECNNEEHCKYCYYCPGVASIENGFMKKSNTFCEHAMAAYNALKT